MKNETDYSLYECPYSHIEKECGHNLQGPEGFENTFGVWCPCGFRGPVFYLNPEELGLKLKAAPVQQTTGASTPLFGGFTPCQWCSYPVPNDINKCPKCGNDKNDPYR